MNSHGEPGGRFFERFFHSQVAGSVVLLAFTVLALVLANSPWADAYAALAHHEVAVRWGAAEFAMPLSHWVADGLMVVFFFVVGLEIKRELLIGELSSLRKAALPVLAALGGAVVPALLYLLCNAGEDGTPHGWGVPMSTDIAFALGMLALFGARVPIELKVFLTALAIADDLGAIAVIAVFYTDEVRWSGLLIAAGGLLAILLLKRLGVRRIGLYALLCVLTWAGVVASGVHATIAGVLLAMVVSVESETDPQRWLQTVRGAIDRLQGSAGLSRRSAVEDRAQMEVLDQVYVATAQLRPAGLAFEQYLHPVQAFCVLPLFALFMAGVPITGEAVAELTRPVGLGVVLGLVVGKQLGITSFAWLAVRLGWAELPRGVTWRMVWAVSCLGGVGFTMALFVSELAFEDGAVVAQARLAILVASAVAAVLGYAALARTLPRAAGDEKSS